LVKIERAAAGDLGIILLEAAGELFFDGKLTSAAGLKTAFIDQEELAQTQTVVGAAAFLEGIAAGVASLQTKKTRKLGGEVHGWGIDGTTKVGDSAVDFVPAGGRLFEPDSHSEGRVVTGGVTAANNIVVAVFQIIIVGAASE